jgi:hypothetical protein
MSRVWSSAKTQLAETFYYAITLGANKITALSGSQLQAPGFAEINLT